MVKPGYKQTEIGVIPEDWYVKDFGQVGSFFKGKGISMSDVKPMGFPCIMYGDIYVKFDTSFSKCDYHIDIKTAANSTRAKKNDLLFTASGETAEDIGRCVSYQGDEDIYIGGDIIALRPNSSCDSLFLSYVQNSFNLKQQKASFAQGNSVVHISLDNIKKTNFACPSTKKEQELIATALSGLDSLIDNLEKLIAKKKAIKQGAMQELLTGKRRLPGFTGEWKKQAMKNYVDFQVGYPFSSDYFNDRSIGLRLIRNRDLKCDDQIIYSTEVAEDSYLVENGDVLIGMDGDFLPCIWKKGRALLNQRVGKLLFCDSMFGQFAYYAFQKPLMELQDGTGATTVKHLSHGDIKKLIVSMPPTINEQIAIASFLGDIDEEIQRYKKQVYKARQVKQGMIQQLLTGKIRLV